MFRAVAQGNYLFEFPTQKGAKAARSMHAFTFSMQTVC